MSEHYGYAEAKTGDGSGAISELDRELDRFEKSLERLSLLLEPVTSRYDAEKVEIDAPHPEPATMLRARTDRLRSQLHRLDRIIDGVDL